MRQQVAPSGSEEKVGPGSRARDEVFAEIRALLDTNSALQLTDFDYRIRQHLHALLGSGGRQRLHEALEAIRTATARKTRKEVKNWPAYLGKLLKKNDDDIAWKDREARARARVERAAAETTPGDGSEKDSKKTTPRELSEEDAWAEAMSKDLSDEDQWFNEFAAAAPPSPKKEQKLPSKEAAAISPLPKESPDRATEQLA